MRNQSLANKLKFYILTLFVLKKTQTNNNNKKARTNWQRTIFEWRYHTDSASAIAIIHDLLYRKVQSDFSRNENERSYDHRRHPSLTTLYFYSLVFSFLVFFSGISADAWEVDSRKAITQ